MAMGGLQTGRGFGAEEVKERSRAEPPRPCCLVSQLSSFTVFFFPSLLRGEVEEVKVEKRLKAGGECWRAAAMRHAACGDVLMQ